MKLFTPVLALLLALSAAPLLAQETAPPVDKPDTTANGDGEPVHGTVDIVVETASGSKTKFLDTPDAINVMGIRKIGERQHGQLPDLLDGLTGIYSQNTASGQGSPFIRGQTGKQVLLLVDGVRFNNSTFRFGPNQYTSSIDPSSIARIEIVRGPSSVLYGSDAMGGVINIILKKPEYMSFDYGFGARGRYESANNRQQLGLFGEVSSTNMGGLFNATYADVGELNGGSSIGRQPFTSFEEWGVSGAFGYTTGDHTFTATYNHFQQNDLDRTDKVTTLVANPGALPAPGVAQDNMRRFVFQIDDMVILGWDWKPGAAMEDLTVNFSYRKQQETLNRIKQGASSMRDMNYNVHTLGLKAQAIFDFGQYSRLTVGSEVYHDIVNSRRVDIASNGDQTHKVGQYPDWASYTSFGVYAQNETRLLNDDLLLRYGVRFSLFRALADVQNFGDGSLPGVNELYSDITGALSAVYKLNKQVSLTMNLARGFRAPNLDDLAASKSTGAGDQIPNPELTSEQQYSIDIGAKAYIGTVNANSWAPYEIMGSINFFFNYLEDLMIREDTTFNGNPAVHLVNGGRGRIFGVEAQVGFYLSEALAWIGQSTDYVFFKGDALGVNMNVTWTRGDDLKNDVPIHRIPPLFAEIAIRYEAGEGAVHLEPFVTIAGRQDQYNPRAAGDVRFTPGDAPGYALFGLRAGWYPNSNLSFNLTIENLGNRSYQEMGSGTFGAGTNVALSGEIRW